MSTNVFAILLKPVTIHSLSACEDGCVMLACRQPSSLADKACEAGTSLTTSDRSVIRRGIRAKYGWSEVCGRRGCE